VQRVTITLDDELVSDIDRLVKDRGYQGRSEAIRDLARAGLQQLIDEHDVSSDCVAALVYVYDHASRELSARLARIFHEHHDVTVSALHVHLDHDTCLEVTVLRGRVAVVQQLGDQVTAERGVRYGRLVIAPAQLTTQRHAHAGERPRRHLHTHVR
jgi:CopG family transcriptional regulator, nickel-responsive regulator